MDTSRWNRGALFLVTLLASCNLRAGAHVDEAAPPAEPLTPVPSTISEEAQAYYRAWRPRPRGGIDWRDPDAAARMREFLGKMFLRNAERAGLSVDLERADISGAEAYWMRGDGQSRDANGSALIYFHGGGYVLGSAKTNVVLPLRVGVASGIPVLTVEYRLAPEHPFPAAVDDALAVYRWLLESGYEPGRIGVFGDSAGGGLTLALALRVRDEGLPQPGALVAISPGADRTGQGDTHDTLDEFDIAIARSSREQQMLYAGDTDLTHPQVSPVYADLSGLGPLLIQVGTRERLLSDAVRLARNARRDGVDVTLDVWEGMWHVWQDHPTIPEATQASNEIGEFFVRHLD